MFLYISNTGNAGISHNSRTAAGFHLCTGTDFIPESICMVSSELVSHFMRGKIHYKRISFRLNMRSIGTPFHSWYANAGNASGITIIIECAGFFMNKMADIIVGITDHIIDRCLCFAVPFICPGICRRVQVNEQIVISDQVHMNAEIAFIDSVGPYQQGSHGGQHFCFFRCIVRFGPIKEILCVFTCAGESQPVSAEFSIIGSASCFS